MQKKNTRPGKKAQKALQPIKKKASHRKKAQKSTMVLLKALATIPAISIIRNHLWTCTTIMI